LCHPAILTINAPAIMKVREVIFYVGKKLYWVVRGVFHGDRDFFISMKNPLKGPNKCFSRIKKYPPAFTESAGRK